MGTPKRGASPTFDSWTWGDTPLRRPTAARHALRGSRRAGGGRSSFEVPGLWVDSQDTVYEVGSSVYAMVFREGTHALSGRYQRNVLERPGERIIALAGSSDLEGCVSPRGTGRSANHAMGPIGREREAKMGKRDARSRGRDGVGCLRSTSIFAIQRSEGRTIVDGLSPGMARPLSIGRSPITSTVIQTWAEAAQEVRIARGAKGTVVVARRFFDRIAVEGLTYAGETRWRYNWDIAASSFQLTRREDGFVIAVANAD